MRNAVSTAFAGLGGCRLFTGGKADFDESFSVFLADPHVCSRQTSSRWLYSHEEFTYRIAEILAMDPLPRNVVVFGDLSITNGNVGDYRLAREELDLLSAAGIRVTIGLGNHDRRNTFLEVFPESASRSMVPGRIVSTADLGTCDLIMLDSLQAPDGAEQGPSAGMLDPAQQEWLADYLPRRTRPVVVAAHHPAGELRVNKRKMGAILQDAPYAVGWINGHEHYWMKEPVVSYVGEASNQDTIRGLHLPSSGFWGDIGYVEFRTYADQAEARLVQKDYWFNSRLRPGEMRPESWTVIIEENDGQICRFPYSRSFRKG